LLLRLVRRRGAGPLRLRHLRQGLPRLPRRRRVRDHALAAELGVVPPVGAGMEGAGTLVPLRRGRRPDRRLVVPAPAAHAQGVHVRTARRGLDALRAGRQRIRVGEGAMLHEARLASGHHDQARPARRRLPRRPDRPDPEPAVLLRLRRGLAQLPGDQLRLRSDGVPRGRMEGWQPTVDLLGEDGRVTRLTTGALVAALAAILLISGCGSGLKAAKVDAKAEASATATQSTPGPPPPAPKVGKCYDLTYKESLQGTSKADP